MSRALAAPWRIVLFGVAVVAANIVVVGIGFAIIGVTPAVRWARMSHVSLSVMASFGAAIAATWLAGRIGDGDSHGVWRRAGLAPGAWQFGPLARASGVAALALLVPVGVLLTVRAFRFEAAVASDSWLVATWAAVALLTPAAAAEELLLRGYLFTVCRDWLGWQRALVATSCAFALLHIFNPGATTMSIVAVAVAGLFLGVVRIVTGSLAAAIAAHLAFNLTQVVVLHAPVSGLAIQTPQYRLVAVGPAWLTGGEWGPEAGAGVMIALLTATFLVGKRTLWPGTKSSPTPAAPP